jgi:hypothetical protein
MAGGAKIRCKRCNEVIQSMHRHDMKWCSCRLIGIDGGSDYTHICYGTDWNSYDECYEVVEVKSTETQRINSSYFSYLDKMLDEKKYTKEQIEAAIRYAVNSAQEKIESQKAGMWYMLDATEFWNYLKDI